MRILGLSPVLLLLAVAFLSLSPAAHGQVGITVSFGPPPLPVYEQPICPGEGYIWTPGYWAWDEDYEDYYWVPGTWVLAPEAGYLWTPPWWGWDNGVYLFHAGWWGPVVGFYGGINYGFGYPGEGFYGGRWDHDHFYYNRSVTNVNVTVIHNVYNETVVNRNVTVNHVSYNGGPGGIQARPRPEDERADQGRHIGPVSAQMQHVQTARTNPELRASQNHGRPAVAATPRPAEFRGTGVVGAREAGGEYHPPANRSQPNRTASQPRPENRPERQPENRAFRPPVHPNDLPAMQRPNPADTGNSARDQKYQQQQQRLFNQQQQQRQQLQQRQEQEHQRMQSRNANQSQTQQMEQRHQEQTQHLQQRQEQQQQHLQQREEGNRKK